MTRAYRAIWILLLSGAAALIVLGGIQPIVGVVIGFACVTIVFVGMTDVLPAIVAERDHTRSDVMR